MRKNSALDRIVKEDVTEERSKSWVIHGVGTLPGSILILGLLCTEITSRCEDRILRLITVTTNRCAGS